MEIDFMGQVLKPNTLAKKLSGSQPSIVYVIGSKAYTQAVQMIKDQPLIFSSLLNWRRFEIGPHTYGISLELPIEMQLFMYSYLFPDIENLGVLYSEAHNSQWFDLAVVKAKEVELVLHGKMIESTNEISKALQTLLPKIDALWLISDPVVLYDTNQVQKIFAEAATRQKPIFAYNTLFTKYGAILTMAADIPTMGRQAAGLAKDILKQQPIDEKVQFPAGSHLTLNLKKVHEYGITLNHAALASVENIIQ
jgi:putative ABC transport system substrate-binding protein